MSAIPPSAIPPYTFIPAIVPDDVSPVTTLEFVFGNVSNPHVNFCVYTNIDPSPYDCTNPRNAASVVPPVPPAFNDITFPNHTVRPGESRAAGIWDFLDRNAVGYQLVGIESRNPMNYVRILKLNMNFALNPTCYGLGRYADLGRLYYYEGAKRFVPSVPPAEGGGSGPVAPAPPAAAAGGAGVPKNGNRKVQNGKDYMYVKGTNGAYTWSEIVSRKSKSRLSTRKRGTRRRKN